MSLIKFKGIDIKRECQHCTMRTVGGRVYIAHDNLIAARFLYECGYDEEQFENDEKIIHHMCQIPLDRIKRLA